MNFDIEIPISINKNNFLIIKNGWPIELSPPPIIQYNLPPDTRGIDKFLKTAVELKKIEKDFILEIKNDFFLFCDACLKLKNFAFDGLVYNIESEKVKLQYNNIWICPYIKEFFKNNIPQSIYVNIKEK